MSTNLGRINQFGGIVLNVIFEQKKSIKRLDSRQNSRLRTRRNAHIVQTAKKLLNIAATKLIQSTFARKIHQLLQIGHIGG